MRIWLRKKRNAVLFVFTGILLVFVLITMSKATYRQEDAFHCHICDGLRYHAPCLIDLSTGDVLELSVYDNDPVKQGELAKNQKTGYFCFMGSGGIIATKDAGKSCLATIPLEDRTINAQLFCEDCKEAISSVSNTGIILADLYNLESIEYYAIEDDAEYSFRSYQIEINKMGDHKIELVVTVIRD